MIPEEPLKGLPAINPKAATKSSTVQDAIRKFLEEAKKVQWDSNTDTQRLWSTIEEEFFGSKGDSILHKLILYEKPQSGPESTYSLWVDRPEDAPPSSSYTSGMRNGNGIPRVDDRGIGTQLLLWLIKHRRYRRFFTDIPEQRGGQDVDHDDPAIHLAITKDNKYFLRCFLGLYYHKDTTAEDKKFIRTVLHGKRVSSKKGNCIHTAIAKCTPFASTFVAMCSDNSLLEKDEDGFTPLHLSLKLKPSAKTPIPSPPASFANQEPPPPWSDTFHAAQLFKEAQIWKKKEMIIKILKTTNKNGVSCLQTAYDNKLTTNDVFRRILKNIIFDNIQSINDARIALYGVAGKSKELFLNMSDFNVMAHDFENYVEKMTSDVPTRTMEGPLQFDALAEGDDLEAASLDTVSLETKDTEARDPESSDQVGTPHDAESNTMIAFEETLFFVHLPDLNFVNQPCQHNTIRKLFRWLYFKNVKTIKKLKIPDSTTNPLSDAFVQTHILNVFKIESLDWRKLDMNLSIIPTSRRSKTLSSLILYSSGNWSVLYHWKSEDGLKSLTKLKSARINIVQLDPSKNCHDAETREAYSELTERYKMELDKVFVDRGVSSQFTVGTDAYWDYMSTQNEVDDHASPSVKHKFLSQLVLSSSLLRQWDVDTGEADKNGFCWEDEKSRFREYALPPSEASIKDKRISVAIIDNGADRIRSNFRHMIADGNSYVTDDGGGSTEPLPWWTVSHPHGTQMASLVSQANSYCRLYIARVGKTRHDINPDRAAEAIRWAMELKVDVISISWTIDRRNEALNQAITDAVNNRILIFCSTPDRGIYSEAWPVEHSGVISVSATDEFGHLTSQTKGDKTANIQIQGMNIPVKLPSYIRNTTPSVSGSSVATALAAGIASLALLMLQIFNERLPDSDGKRHKYYTKNGMLEVFKKMEGKEKGIHLSKMFPGDCGSTHKNREALAKCWTVEEWPENS